MANLIIYGFISGATVFIGLLLTIAGVAMRSRSPVPMVKRYASIPVFLGILLTIATCVPYPIWILLSEAGLVLGGLFCVFAKSEKIIRVAMYTTVVCALVIAAVELYFQRSPNIAIDGFKELFVVGDSLSMGADPPGKNWPDLLGENLGLPTHAYSFGGARTDTALSNAKRITGDQGLVILEIGGNDLLYDTPDFSNHLELLLQVTCKGQRRVVMVELPLPPFYVHYGSAQRRLAAKYGVTLIPKRVLAGVITSEGATTDSLHLSNTGHKMLATSFTRHFRSKTIR
jgi:acyl-CoA thioesterase-1